MPTKILTTDEVDLVASASLERIGQHAIGFVRVIGDEQDAVIAGSGTLITVGRRHAILTADHVLERLPSSGPIWLVRCREGWTQPHRLNLDAATVQKITVGKASHTSDGPDLGLLLLSHPDVARLETTQAFYNLDKRRAEVGSSSITPYGWCLFGMIDENTIESPPQRRFSRVKGFNGSVLFGAEPIQRSTGDFDYLDFVAVYDDHYTGPETYQGVSGGGLWQVDYRQLENGSVTVATATLSGLAYFEGPKIAGKRIIYCHGRRSIYELVYKSLSDL